MNMFQPAPLETTSAALRRNERDLLSYIDELCNRIDATEPVIQALMPEAGRRTRLKEDTVALWEHYPDSDSRPALYGVPVGVKDVFSVDGFETRAGSRLPPGVFLGPEATCVSRLRKAGALILGKTCSTEFAYFEPGPTRNPRNPNHTPGGSSSGSAAAVAAGFCPLAIGTQTIGSTIRPAAFCGIAGFKPSYGRIPTNGMIHCAPSLDTVGFFAQDVAGLAIVAPLLCDDWQPVSIHAATFPVLGVPEGPYLAQASPEGLAAFEKQVYILEQAGYTVQRVKAMNTIAEINHRHNRLVFAEMAQVHATWFAQYELLYRPRTAAAIREGQEVSTEELADTRAGRSILRIDLAALMALHGIDLWVCPSAPGSAPEGIDATGSPIMNLPWTHAGLPAVSLPAGRSVNGLPLGLQCVGGFMADEQLLSWVEPIASILAYDGTAAK